MLHNLLYYIEIIDFCNKKAFLFRKARVENPFGTPLIIFSITRDFLFKHESSFAYFSYKKSRSRKVGDLGEGRNTESKHRLNAIIGNATYGGKTAIIHLLAVVAE